ncbi:MAG: FeoA family protein [Bacillota bacterium]|nr:FeoA family protein [Bacillota bacterium]
MRNLHEVKAGQRAVIVDVQGSSRFLSRATSIGLTRGLEIEMLHNEARLPLLLFGRDTVIALNREDGQQIQVEVVA